MIKLSFRRWVRRGPDLISALSANDLTESLYFDPFTGETHTLSVLSSMVLAEMDSTPRSYQQLMDLLAGETALSVDDRGRFLAAILSLEKSGIIEPIDGE